MISLKSICKSYMIPHIGAKQILRNITIDIPHDKSIGILGRNGAGKSTFMRLLSGTEMADSGTIDMDGTRLSWPLGNVSGVHGSMSGAENIRFITRLYDYPYQKAFDFVEEFAELGDYMHLPVKNYSSGMKSRLAFGVSMILDFDTYLIDEGFSAGDARFRQKSQDLFDEKRKNANLIVVSHNPATIRRLCDWGVVLHNGEMKIIEDIEQAIEEYKKL